MNLFRKMTATTAIVALASGLMVSGASAYTNADVENANYLANEGIIVNNAAAPANYELDRNVLRQEIAAVSRGIAKLPKTTTCTNQFSDVTATTPNTWACYTVEALRNAGLIAANPTFRPEANITKSEAIGMVVKACKGNDYAYDASKPGNWQAQVVNYAANNGYTQNFTDYNALATRGFIFSAAANCYKTKSDVAIDPTDAICQLLGTCNETTTGNNNNNNDNTNTNTNVVGKAVVTLAPQSPTDGIVAEGSSRTPVLAFEVTAGTTDVTLNRANLRFTGLGDSKLLKNIAIYSNEVKVSKGDKTFNSKNEANVSFDRDVVVKAGETQTFVVTATVEVPYQKDLEGKAVLVNGEKQYLSTFNQNLRVNLSGLEASSPVEGATITGANLTPTLVQNKADVDFRVSSANGRAYLGENTNLYNFTLKETERKEDVRVRSVTFEAGEKNEFDLEYLTDPILYINGQKVNATFTTKRSKIVATFDYTIKAGATANFRFDATPIDDLNKKLVLTMTGDAVYMVGAVTGTSLAMNRYDATNPSLITTKTIEGAAVNFAFVENAAKEVGIDTYDAQIGTLTFVSNAEYNANLSVQLVADEKTINGIGTSLEINGESGTRSPISNSGTGTQKMVTFTFKDIYIAKGNNSLPLTVDIANTATADSKLTVTVKVNSLEDDSLGDKLSEASLKRTLNNSEITRSVFVKAPELKLITKIVDNTTVVPRNSQRVVLYKGEINVSNSENITIETMNFTKQSGPSKLVDYLSNATLNIGGKTFSGEVNDDSILFTSVFAEIQKGARSVEVLVTGTLRDKEITDSIELGIELKNSKDSVRISAQNARDPDVVVTGEVSTKVFLTKSGTLQADSITNVSNDNTVLAGTNGVTLARFRLRAQFEDLDVKELTLNTMTQDKLLEYWKTTTWKDDYVLTEQQKKGMNLTSVGGLKLMDGSKELASGGVVTFDETNKISKVKFENFTLPSSSEYRNITLVGDLARFNDAGGTASAFIGDVKFSKINYILNNTASTSDSKDIKSDMVSIVPAIIKVSKTSDLFGENDAKAVVKVNVEKWDNSISTLQLTKVNFALPAEVSSIQVNNETSVNYNANSFAAIDITDKSNFDLTITLKGSSDEGSARLNNFKLDDMSFHAQTGTKPADFNSVRFNSDLGSYFETN